MSERHIALYRPLMDYIEFWERLRRRSIPLVIQIVHPGMQYLDPFRNLQGVESFTDHLEDRFEIFDQMKFKCTNYAWAERGAGNTAYMHWHLTTKRKPKSKEITTTGVAEVTFYEDNTVRSHVDHWHTTEDIFAAPSLRRTILKTLIE